MKIIIYDIEITPKLGWFYPPDYETKALHIERDWHVMCFAWKELGKKKVHFHALNDYAGYEEDPYNDKELLLDLRKMLDDADVVIGHNSDKFDEKKANARFVYHGITPPSPYERIDTLKIARANFKFDSNRLNDLGEYLGLGTKKGSHKDLWKDCIDGDKKAWKKMEQYNKQDIVLTEKVYLKIRGWAKVHPHMDKYRKKEDVVVCKKCTSLNVIRRGYIAAASKWKRRYYCNECNTWFQGTKSFKIKPEDYDKRR